MDTNEVAFAFDILLEAVEAVIDRINEAGAEAFRRGEYREAQQLLGTATQLLDVRDQVIAMRRTWVQRSNQLSSPWEGRPRKTRREHGWRTPQEAFRRTILEALVELGGRASSAEVLERVGQRLADRLTPADHEPLPSNGQIRWQNTARWCRNDLVREGLLSDDSPRGLWEIAERGRRALVENADL